jgi:hypothetical protein
MPKAYSPEFRDPVDLPEASYEHHPIDDIEPLPDMEEKLLKLASALRYIASEIIRARNPGLTAECLGVAIGLQFDRSSQTEIAEAHGVTRAEVSAKVLDFQTQLGIGENGFNKSRRSRRNYAKTNSRRTKI